VRWRTQGRARALPEELAVMLFKSAQELLTNSHKHSGAGGAELSLNWSAEALSLSVADTGCGCRPEQAAGQSHDGFGLFSIRERFRDLGGSVEIVSAPDAGCRVRLTVPLGPTKGA
jgi:signal transduction histidine kinase